MTNTETPVTNVPTKPKRRAMNIVLWILQIVLAFLYLMAGFQKAFRPLDQIVETIFWVAYVPHWLVRFIGVSELLGAVGLIVPAATKIQPLLTTFAATGLAVIMASANIMHAVRGEYSVLPFTLVLFCLDAFVSYGRWNLVPFLSGNTKK
jgi:putative oxidoreductase